MELKLNLVLNEGKMQTLIVAGGVVNSKIKGTLKVLSLRNMNLWHDQRTLNQRDVNRPCVNADAQSGRKRSF